MPTITYLPSEVPAAIAGLNLGADTSNDTVTAGAMKAGTTAHDSNMRQITGTMPNFNLMEFGELENPPEEGYISGATMEALARAIMAAIGSATVDGSQTP